MFWEEWDDGVLSSTRGGDVRDVGMLGGRKPLQGVAAPRLCWAKRSSESFGLLPAGAAKVVQEGALAGRFCSVERIERLVEGVAEQCCSTARLLHSGRSKL